jgi:hypothetical protein
LGVGHGIIMILIRVSGERRKLFSKNDLINYMIMGHAGIAVGELWINVLLIMKSMVILFTPRRLVTWGI